MDTEASSRKLPISSRAKDQITVASQSVPMAAFGSQRWDAACMNLAPSGLRLPHGAALLKLLHALQALVSSAYTDRDRNAVQPKAQFMRTCGGKVPLLQYCRECRPPRVPDMEPPDTKNLRPILGPVSSNGSIETPCQQLHASFHVGPAGGSRGAA